MKKLFSFLSIVFALLAGFSACGNTKTDNYTDSEIADSNDKEYVSDCVYGIGYDEFEKDRNHVHGDHGASTIAGRFGCGIRRRGRGSCLSAIVGTRPA